MASALHKWMAQNGTHDMHIDEEEADKIGVEHDDGTELKHEMHGSKPFDISQEHASLLGLGEEHGAEGEHGHMGAGMRGKETSGAMHPEHMKLLGMMDDDDEYC